MIYAQRPNATAVLELEKWNRQFGRWVNAGATGIAVIAESRGKGFHRAIVFASVRPGGFYTGIHCI